MNTPNIKIATNEELVEFRDQLDEVYKGIVMVYGATDENQKLLNSLSKVKEGLTDRIIRYPQEIRQLKCNVKALLLQEQNIKKLEGEVVKGIRQIDAHLRKHKLWSSENLFSNLQDYFGNDKRFLVPHQITDIVEVILPTRTLIIDEAGISERSHD